MERYNWDILLGQGDSLTDSTGVYVSEPFPKFDMSTDRKATNSLKRVHTWLIQTAIDYARFSGNEFAARIFESESDFGKAPQATLDSAALILEECYVIRA